MTKWLVLGIALAAAACGEDGPVAKYDIPTAGSIAWGAAPFPNDLYLGEDGTVDLAALPSTSPLWESVREQLNTRRGFCGTCTIHFPISGSVQPGTIASGVLMIDSMRRKVPIDAEWDAQSSVIAVRPKRGVVLEPGQRYTVGLTNAVRNADGNSLRAADGFKSARARVVTDPAVTALMAAGANGTVVAATTFTVEDPTLLAKDLAARVATYYASNGPPVVTVERVWRSTDGTLDDLLGTPAQALLGNDNPALAGSIGKYAITHDLISTVVLGRFNSVRVVSGTGKDLGMLQPETVAGDGVPFMLVVPTGVDVTNMPVIVFGHGAGGVMGQILSFGDTAARAHSAVLALETFQHGERAPSGADTEHALRGDGGELGPDGFYESNVASVVLRLFGVDGVAPDQKASPLYLQGTVAQMAADLHALLAVVGTSDLTPIANADASLAGLAFDQARVFYVGLSLGTVYGSVMLAGDTRVAAAALNVPVASIAETLVENEAFRTQLETLMLDPLDIPNDMYEPERHLIMNPLMSFFQWTLHGVEPLALARSNVSHEGRDLLVQIAGLDELAGTPSGEGLVSAAGMPALGDFAYASVMSTTAPIQGSGAALFPQADHAMIAYQNGASKVEPPGLPPFEPRATTLKFANPISGVHDQLTHFFETRSANGVAEIR